MFGEDLAAAAMDLNKSNRPLVKFMRNYLFGQQKVRNYRNFDVQN